MSYVVVALATVEVGSEGSKKEVVELTSDILSTVKEAEELATTLIQKMGFVCKIEPYDSEPAEPPYGAYKGEE